MALTYAEKLNFSKVIRDKFTEIKELKILINEAVENRDKEQYDYLVNIVFGKISVVEKSLTELKKLFIERMADAR